MANTGSQLLDISDGPVKPAATVARKGASILMTSANLASSIIGSGILALSYSFKVAGSLLGSIILIIAAALTCLCFCLLSYSSDHSGFYSFRGLSQATFGRHGIILTAIVVFLSTYGFACMYVVISGDLTMSFLGNVVAAEAIPKWLNANILKTLYLVIIMAPLSLFRRISAFAVFSFIALIFIVYAIIVVFYYFGVSLHTQPHYQEINLANWNFQSFMALPVFIFAFGAAPAVPPLLAEIDGRSVKKMNISSIITCVFCSIAYLAIGLSGAFLYGDDVPDNVLLRLGKSVEINIGLVGFVYVVIVSYPIVLFSNYRVIYDLIAYIIEERKRKKDAKNTGNASVEVLAPINTATFYSSAQEEEDEKGETIVVPEPEPHDPENIDDIQPIKEKQEAEKEVWYGWGWHVLLVYAEAAVVLILAILVPKLAVISGVIGAVAGVPMYFALPVLLHLFTRNYPWSLPLGLRRATGLFSDSSGYRELTPDAQRTLPVIQEYNAKYAMPNEYPDSTAAKRFFHWCRMPQNIFYVIILILCPFILVIGVISTVIG